MFCSRTLNTRIDRLHERALRILYRDDVSSFVDLLEREKSITIRERNIKLLAAEMYKVNYVIPPNALGDFVSRRDLSYNLRNASSYMREKVNTIDYGTESISTLGPKIWDILTTGLKEAGNLGCFKSRIKNWKVENCP